MPLKKILPENLIANLFFSFKKIDYLLLTFPKDFENFKKNQNNKFRRF